VECLTHAKYKVVVEMSALCILSCVCVCYTLYTILPFESEFYHRYRVQNFGFKTEKRTSQEEAKKKARCHTPTVSRFCYLLCSSDYSSCWEYAALMSG
jgi:hypothetical protein